MNTRVPIFGDSITWGACDEEGGWVNRIKKYVDKKRLQEGYESAIYPLGISGDSSEDLLKRFENEIQARIDEDGGLAIVIAIGVNDSQVLLSDMSNKISPEMFQSNIDSLINRAKKYTRSVLLLGLTPVDQRVNPMSWKEGYAYLLNQVKKYNDMLKEIAEKQKVDFIDILAEFLKTDYESLLFDGLHPNSEGHTLMYNFVIKHFIQKKFI